jgi:plasmid stabilization system protein ParE
MSDALKAYKVIVHDGAAQMLYDHVHFVANVSIPAARKLRSIFYKAFASLESIPLRCPVYRTRRASGAYRQLIAGRYQIIFSVNEAEGIVRIEYILDSRQDNDV